MTSAATIEDQLQRNLAASDLNTSYLVEAAAGTGKTTLLVDRIVCIVRSGRSPLYEVAAVTFTEKAAGELKVKLRERLERYLAEASEAESERWATALKDLDRMSVSTIHGFCAELLRERPVEAAVEPGFEVADDVAAGVLFQRAWDEFWGEALSCENPALRLAFEAGFELRPPGSQGKSVFDILQYLSENRDLWERCTVDRGWSDEEFRATAQAMVAEIQALEKIRDDFCKDESDGAAENIDKLRIWAAGVEWETAEEIIRRALTSGETGVKNNSGNQKNWREKEVLVEVKGRVKRLKADIAELQRRAGQRVAAQLVGELRPLLERYQQMKAQEGVLDFADLLLKTRDMLASSRSARDYFKRKYRFVLVDEFQDTDPIQAEIVFYLCERPDQHAERWDRVQLEPGKCFIVGDPKQSIYGFRRADLEPYGRVREIFARQGRVENIRVNFRMVPGLIDEVNRVFPQWMKGPVSEGAASKSQENAIEGAEQGAQIPARMRYEPEYVPLVAYRSAQGRTCSVIVLRPPQGFAESEEKLTADIVRRKESGAIAAAIRELTSSGREVYDGALRRWRPVRFSDIAVLYRATTGLNEIQDALEAREIPYQVAGGRRYYARLETRHLLAVLEAVESPHDAASVVGALRSPFFGCPDDEIFLHVTGGGSLNYLRTAQGSPLEGAFGVLRELHEKRSERGPSETVRELFERTGALPLFGIKPQGERRVANLLRAADLARAFERSQGTSLRAFVRWLRSQERLGRGEEESPAVEPGEDFVQLLTFHKAKGLEFPVVILAHLAGEIPKRESAVFTLKEDGLRLEVNFGKKLATGGWEEARVNREDRERHEAMRLLYVAMTRARDCLVVPLGWRKTKGDAGGLLEFLAGWPMHAAGDGTGGASVEEWSTQDWDLDRRPNQVLRVRLDAEREQSSRARRLWEQRGAWAEALERRVRRANAAAKVVAPAAVAPRGGFPKERPAAVAALDPTRLGDLTHRVLELADAGAASDLKRLARVMAARRGLGDDYVEASVELVSRALDSPLFRERLPRARQVYREMPFAFDLEGILCEGVMDLVFVEDGRAVIVDYKTDEVTAEEASRAAERYRPQVGLYALALERILGRMPAEGIILFVRPCREVSFPVDEAFLREARAVLVDAPSVCADLSEAFER